MSFGLICLAEFLKLSSRASARVGWIASLLLGIGIPLFIFALANSGMIVNGVSSVAYFDGDGTRAHQWALFWRNLLLIRAFLVVLGSQSLAGELADRTLREDLMAPVPRDQVVFAKWFALLGWDAISLGLMFLSSTLIAIPLLGPEGVWLATVAAFAINFVCDAALLAVVLAVAALTRSVVATVAGMLVALIFDKMFGLVISFAAGVAGMVTQDPRMEQMLNQWPLLPSAALNLWTAPLPDNQWDVRSVATLMLMLAGGLLVAMFRVRRLPVP